MTIEEIKEIIQSFSDESRGRRLNNGYESIDIPMASGAKLVFSLMEYGNEGKRGFFCNHRFRDQDESLLNLEDDTIQAILNNPLKLDTIALIESEDVQRFTLELMKDVPAYFWEVSSSSTGKHHSQNQSGEGGLWKHTEALCFIAKDMYRPGLYELTKRELDLAIAALHLHDTFARGLTEGEYTVVEHPLLASEYVRNHPMRNILPTEDVEIICGGIERHMGRWTDNREGVKILEAPETDFQKFVHLCDYIGSRKNLEFVKPTNEAVGK